MLRTYPELLKRETDSSAKTNILLKTPLPTESEQNMAKHQVSDQNMQLSL